MNKKTKFLKEFIEHQYKMVGSDKTIDYAVNNELWFEEYSLSEKEKAALWIWGFKAWRKRFKTSHNDTIQQFSDFYDAYSFPVRREEGTK